MDMNEIELKKNVNWLSNEPSTKDQDFNQQFKWMYTIISKSLNGQKTDRQDNQDIKGVVN